MHHEDFVVASDVVHNGACEASQLGIEDFDVEIAVLWRTRDEGEVGQLERRLRMFRGAFNRSARVSWFGSPHVALNSKTAIRSFGDHLSAERVYFASVPQSKENNKSYYISLKNKSLRMKLL